MDVSLLGDIRHRCQRLTQRLDSMERNLPQAGEPREVYALRTHVTGDDVLSARIALQRGSEAWIVYIQTIVNLERVHDEIIQPLQGGSVATGGSSGPPILARATPVPSLEAQTHNLVSGHVVIFAGGSASSLDLTNFPARPPSEPSTEKTILGSKQGLTESLNASLGALRDRVRSPQLCVEMFEIGLRSRTRVALVYLRDVANPDVVDLTRQGLETITTSHIRTANELGEYLFQGTLTTIPLAEQTERPDRAAYGISDGRICLVVDGTPFVLLAPTTFFENLHDTESAVPGPITVAFVRFIRLLGLVASLTAAGLYAAVLTVDTPLLPTPLALAVAASRTGVPYPVLTETLIMLLVVDIFSESTAQAPGGLGSAISIVGTLIIGEMAVEARLASSLMLIVIAVTALGSFLTLKYPFSYTLRIWKYPIALLAGLFGLFGWMAALLLFLTHLTSLKSAGVPYMSPLGPLQPRTMLQSAMGEPSGRRRIRRPGTWDVQDIRIGGRRP